MSDHKKTTLISQEKIAFPGALNTPKSSETQQSKRGRKCVGFHSCFDCFRFLDEPEGHLLCAVFSKSLFNPIYVLTLKSKGPSSSMEVLWTDYMKYRAALRGFDLTKVEDIVRYSTERYFDTETGRWVVIGHHDTKLVMIAYEVDQTSFTPITIHTTTRQQIRFRIRTRRYTYE